MAGWQQMIIVGNVGRDVNMKYTQSGVPVADFSVAVTRRFGGRDGGERHRHVDQAEAQDLVKRHGWSCAAECGPARRLL